MFWSRIEFTGRFADLAICRLEQRVGIGRLFPLVHVRPLLVDDRVQVRPKRRADLAALGERRRISIDRRNRGGLFVGPALRVLEALPHAERDEREQDRINHADDGKDEAGTIVVSGANLGRREAGDQISEDERRNNESADGHDPGQHRRERFEPRDHGSGSREAAPNVVDCDGFSGTPDVTSWR